MEILILLTCALSRLDINENKKIFEWELLWQSDLPFKWLIFMHVDFLYKSAKAKRSYGVNKIFQLASQFGDLHAEFCFLDLPAVYLFFPLLWISGEDNPCLNISCLGPIEDDFG